MKKILRNETLQESNTSNLTIIDTNKQSEVLNKYTFTQRHLITKARFGILRNSI